MKGVFYTGIRFMLFLFVRWLSFGRNSFEQYCCYVRKYHILTEKVIFMTELRVGCIRKREGQPMRDQSP